MKHASPCYNIIQGGPKVSTHTLGLIALLCFTFEGCCFADGILYVLVRGFRRQNLKIRVWWGGGGGVVAPKNPIPVLPFFRVGVGFFWVFWVFLGFFGFFWVFYKFFI